MEASAQIESFAQNTVHYLNANEMNPPQAPAAPASVPPSGATAPAAPAPRGYVPSVPAPAETTPPAAAATAAPPAASAAPASQEYVLEPGDHIHLTVYDEEDLSGDYIVADTGFVALPLIGNIMAARTTTHQLEAAIRLKLQNGYLHDPKVSIQLLNYRPFFIIGEVAKPGSYPYVDGMNVLNAVALAGGYTYRASTGGIRIIHASDPAKKEQNVEETAPVKPGDIIKVPERLF